MTLKVTVLGCGNSTGVPAVGNFWGKCDPNEPKNRRTRPSICLQTAETTIVIDTGADFREQMNRENITNLDAVLYTHAHGDHVSGIDDLRSFNFRNKCLTPVYGDQATLEELERRFYYLFQGGDSDIYPAVLRPHIIDSKDFGEAHIIGDIEFIPFEQDHGTVKSVGYRFGDFAYSTDILDLNHEAIETLKGVQTWIVDGAGYTSDTNPVHASFEKIFQLNEQIGAENVYFTSLSLIMDYRIMCDELPSGYEPAFDGLSLSFN